MTEPATDPPRCCGKVPASTRGGPIALVCLLCPNSGAAYWRNGPGVRDRLAAAEDHHARTGHWLPDR